MTVVYIAVGVVAGLCVSGIALLICLKKKSSRAKGVERKMGEPHGAEYGMVPIGTGNASSKSMSKEYGQRDVDHYRDDQNDSLSGTQYTAAPQQPAQSQSQYTAAPQHQYAPV